jgi:hypothetical protein
MFNFLGSYAESVEYFMTPFIGIFAYLYQGFEKLPVNMDPSKEPDFQCFEQKLIESDGFSFEQFTKLKEIVETKLMPLNNKDQEIFKSFLAFHDSLNSYCEEKGIHKSSFKKISLGDDVS